MAAFFLEGRVISEDEFRAMLIAEIERCGGNSKFADKYGFTRTEVSAWKTGRNPFYPAICAALGYERVVMYVPTSRVELPD